MAQVYQFVDENGVTRLFAEIQPDPAGTPFNGGTITRHLYVEPGASENQTAITADATGSGNLEALATLGQTTLDDGGLGVEPLIVDRSSVNVLRVDLDGKLRVTPTANATGTQPAFEVDAAAAITMLLRARTNGTTCFSVDNTGRVDAGAWLIGSDGGTQIVAAGTGSDIELCDSGSNIVVQVTDAGTLGFFNHAASAKPTVTGAKLPSDVALASLLTALSGLGLITDSTT